MTKCDELTVWRVGCVTIWPCDDLAVRRRGDRVTSWSCDEFWLAAAARDLTAGFMEGREERGGEKKSVIPRLILHFNTGYIRPFITVVCENTIPVCSAAVRIKCCIDVRCDKLHLKDLQHVKRLWRFVNVVENGAVRQFVEAVNRRQRKILPV